MLKNKIGEAQPDHLPDPTLRKITSLVAFLVRLISGLHARWLGVDPSECQRVYFANHTSILDAAVLWGALPSSIRAKTRAVAAKDYWTASALRRWLANDVFRALLIERRKVTSENNPLREMLAVLDAGDSLIIFPEGGRFPGPEPQKFKGGLFHLAKNRPQVQFVPVYPENLNRILPKSEILPVPLLGSITVGSPIRLEPGETKADFLDRARLAVWSLRLT